MVELTKASIWLVVACYGIILWRHPSPRISRLIRVAWLVGLLAYSAHVILAFAVYYDWSWALAWRETADDAERLTGVRAGWGLWLNVVFGIVWAVLAWQAWRSKGSGPVRQVKQRLGLPRWLALGMHGFLIFMVIQGGVVFAPAAARVFTATVLICVAIRALLCVRRRRSPTT